MVKSDGVDLFVVRVGKILVCCVIVLYDAALFYIPPPAAARSRVVPAGSLLSIAAWSAAGL